jgi:hypothetical protein
LKPRPLSYEPYDPSLCPLERSLAAAVTSADGSALVSHRRLRLPRLVLSRRVRFTNRFTEQGGTSAGSHTLPGLRGQAADRFNPRIKSRARPVSKRSETVPPSDDQDRRALGRRGQSGSVHRRCCPGCCSPFFAPVVLMVQAAGATRVPRSTLDSSRLPYRSRSACQAASFFGRIR